MSSATNRAPAVTKLMIRNLDATVKELVAVYNETGSPVTYKQIQAVRAERTELAKEMGMSNANRTETNVRTATTRPLVQS